MQYPNFVGGFNRGLWLIDWMVEFFWGANLQNSLSLSRSLPLSLSLDLEVICNVIVCNYSNKDRARL